MDTYEYVSCGIYYTYEYVSSGIQYTKYYTEYGTACLVSTYSMVSMRVLPSLAAGNEGPK